MNQKRKNVILLDSSDALYRYYHAKIDTIIVKHNEREMDVTALHYYMRYRYSLEKVFEFDKIIHILDPKGGSEYRKKLYPEYKQNRSPTPDDFLKQKTILPEILKSLNEYFVVEDGVESDDVIASLAHKYKNDGYGVLIISRDKDLLQLVKDDEIGVCSYMKDKSTNRNIHNIYDEAGVFKKFGVRPEQIPDFLAIVGDVSDNIKGIKDVGPKTATVWLDKYGDILNLMTHNDEIIGKKGDNLRKSMENLPLMKKLTTTQKNLKIEYPQNLNDMGIEEKEIIKRKNLALKFIKFDQIQIDNLNFLDKNNLNIKKNNTNIL